MGETAMLIVGSAATLLKLVAKSEAA